MAYTPCNVLVDYGYTLGFEPMDDGSYSVYNESDNIFITRDVASKFIIIPGFSLCLYYTFDKYGYDGYYIDDNIDHLYDFFYSIVKKMYKDLYVTYECSVGGYKSFYQDLYVSFDDAIVGSLTLDDDDSGITINIVLSLPLSPSDQVKKLKYSKQYACIMFREAWLSVPQDDYKKLILNILIIILSCYNVYLSFQTSYS